MVVAFRVCDLSLQLPAKSYPNLVSQVRNLEIRLSSFASPHNSLFSPTYIFLYIHRIQAWLGFVSGLLICGSRFSLSLPTSRSSHSHQFFKFSHTTGSLVSDVELKCLQVAFKAFPDFVSADASAALCLLLMHWQRFLKDIMISILPRVGLLFHLIWVPLYICTSILWEVFMTLHFIP